MDLKKYQKKGGYLITATVAIPGVRVYNFLEDANYVTSEKKCIILTGTRGEQWVVDREKLAKTYIYTDGTPIDAENLPKVSFIVTPVVGEDAACVFAEQTTEQVKVNTSWGVELTANREGIPHGEGDFIIYADDGTGKPNPNNSWVVNGLVFLDTYREVKA